MKLDGRRESTNVDDRRHGGGRRLALGGGIVGIIIAALITWISGGDMGSVMQVVGDGIQQQITAEGQAGDHEFTAEEDSLAKFSRQILASTEDVWTEQFRQMGKQYNAPKMVLYTGSVQTSCGNGSASMGPFYCGGDQCVYLDLSFFSNMKREIGARGEFANAYVIAHEVGHHIQQELGILGRAHQKMSQLSKAEANEISVRIELQADFFAGLWGHYENKTFNSISDKEIAEAIDCAHKIGDNYLQQKAQGYTVPESFTHGTSEQRMRWFKLGLKTGDINQGDTFSKSKDEL
ncbi:MAG: neutral zinc metallopeptidase [Bacteroidaceae bacterium]|nr:neutral zinc metallopeptidase [Bacteroidaceae bacterium]